MNKERNDCSRLFRCLRREQPNRTIESLLGDVRASCPHGTTNKTRSFPPGMEDMVSPDRSQIIARTIYVIHDAAMSSGLCDEHKPDIPLISSSQHQATYSDEGCFRLAVLDPREGVSDADIAKLVFARALVPLGLFGYYTAHYSFS